MRYDKAKRRDENLRQKLLDAEARATTASERLSLIERTLDSTLHEIRRFSAEVSTHAEELSKALMRNENGPETKAMAQTVFFIAGMISSRLAFTDIELNPGAIRSQQRVRSGLYKKFDKARRVLEERARHKRVRIELLGASHKEIEALPAFECVPFVLLDNAVKYSPQGQDVSVRFDEGYGRLRITVQNIGPTVEPAELAQVFKRGQRGSLALRSGIAGDGQGLYLALYLCELHGIRIRATSSSSPRFQLDGIPYSDFEVSLEL